MVEQCQRVAEVTNMVLQQNTSRSSFRATILLHWVHWRELNLLSPIKPLGQLVDAHADLHSPLSSPSGNIHGMPLAAALSNDNTEYAVNTIDETTQTSWNQMKAMGGEEPKLRPEHLVYFSLRSTEARDRV